MKQNRIIGSILALAFGLMSCSENDDKLPSNQGTAISFGISEVNSKATEINESNLRKIGMFGYSHEGSFLSSAAATASPDWFLNWPLIKPVGENSWSYPGSIRYWPQDGRMLSFFAYAPYDDLGETIKLYPSKASDTGSPTLTYTIPTDDYTKHVDLLCASTFNQDYSTSTVLFEMKHVLTKVKFQLTNTSGTKVSGIAVYIGGITDSGEYDFLNDSWSIGDQNALYTVTNFFDPVTIENGQTLLFPAEDEGCLFFIPQNFNESSTDGSAVILEFDITDSNGTTQRFTITNKFSDYFEHAWELGKSYQYQIEINSDIAQPIYGNQSSYETNK